MSAAIELLISSFDANQPCALATIIRIDGRAPRRVGAQMAITMDASAGSLSGGCLDATIIEQTRARLIEAKSFQLSFGEDSPFMDLKLPCGSNIELQVDCALEASDVQQIKSAFQARHSYALYWNSLETPARFASALRSQGTMQFPYYPKLRIVVAGKGETLIALAAIAMASDVEFLALSPEQETLQRLHAMDVAANWLSGKPSRLEWDGYTAAITVFHDHDLELPFLSDALGHQPLLIGAMGAPKAKQMRAMALAELGFAEQDIARIESPFGLIARARDPHTLAVSMLAACVQRYRDQYFPESGAMVIDAMETCSIRP